MSVDASADMPFHPPVLALTMVHLLAVQWAVSLAGMKSLTQSSPAATASTHSSEVDPTPGVSVVQLLPFQRCTLVFSPVTQTSFGPVPDTESSGPEKLPAVENAEPFQRSTTVEPANQTSLELDAHTESRSVVGPLTSDHAVPLKCTTVPTPLTATPLAHTSDELNPHTPRRWRVVGLVIWAHVPLPRRRIVPLSPPANTSLALAAHTPCSRAVVGEVSWHQVGQPTAATDS